MTYISILFNSIGIVILKQKALNLRNTHDFAPVHFIYLSQQQVYLGKQQKEKDSANFKLNTTAFLPVWFLFWNPNFYIWLEIQLYTMNSL